MDVLRDNRCHLPSMQDASGSSPLHCSKSEEEPARQQVASARRLSTSMQQQMPRDIPANTIPMYIEEVDTNTHFLIHSVQERTTTKYKITDAVCSVCNKHSKEPVYFLTVSEGESNYIVYLSWTICLDFSVYCSERCLEIHNLTPFI